MRYVSWDGACGVGDNDAELWFEEKIEVQTIRYSGFYVENRAKNRAKDGRFWPRFFGPSKDAGRYLSDIWEKFKVSRQKIGWPFYVI